MQNLKVSFNPKKEKKIAFKENHSLRGTEGYIIYPCKYPTGPGGDGPDSTRPDPCWSSEAPVPCFPASLVVCAAIPLQRSSQRPGPLSALYNSWLKPGDVCRTGFDRNELLKLLWDRHKRGFDLSSLDLGFLGPFVDFFEDPECCRLSGLIVEREFQSFEIEFHYKGAVFCLFTFCGLTKVKGQKRRDFGGVCRIDRDSSALLTYTLKNS